MQNLRYFLALLLLFTRLLSHGQNDQTIRDYIAAYKDIAIEEMQRTGVPASIKLAQGIHETMAGTSDLVLKSNNHFGIKCKTGWKGESVSHDDDARGECFRKYDSPLDSYRDHSNFLRGGQRYASLFDLDPLDYSGWAYGLKKAGYATNPKYPQIIIKLIEDYNLQDYSLIALGKEPVKDEGHAQITSEAKEVTDEPVKTAPVAADQGASSVKQEKAREAIQYPSGVFKINETKVIYVKAGTAFLTIANEHDIPLAKLFEFNDREETETLEKDALIYLQRKRKTGKNEFHIVEAGETLDDIAAVEAIRMESLLEYNQLEPGAKPAVGEKLFLQKKSAAPPKLAGEERKAARKPAEKKELVAYTVKRGETIYSISKKYNVTIDDIMQWNKLKSHELKAGQQLKIYQ